MSVSVVVPSRDRPEALAVCLAALADQQAVAIEIVVVDDGSTDRDAIAAVIAASACDARLLRTPGRGPAAARNLGARAAAGEVICFTDDDCEPFPRWAATLAASARESGAAAGRTVARRDAGPAVVASQAIVEHLTRWSLDPTTGRLRFAPTCNLALTPAVAERLAFDESYPTAAGEDRDWSDRAARAGIGPIYVEGAVVVHRQRLGAAGFARQQYGYGRGAARFRGGDGDRRLATPGFYAGLLRRGFGEGAAAGSLVIAAQALAAAGVASERVARVRAGHRPG